MNALERTLETDGTVWCLFGAIVTVVCLSAVLSFAYHRLRRRAIWKCQWIAVSLSEYGSAPMAFEHFLEFHRLTRLYRIDSSDVFGHDIESVRQAASALLWRKLAHVEDWCDKLRDNDNSQAVEAFRKYTDEAIGLRAKLAILISKHYESRDVPRVFHDRFVTSTVNPFPDETINVPRDR